MKKIQSIIFLFIFIILIFSMDMIFGNPLRETFKGIRMSPIGSDINSNQTIIQRRNVSNKSNDEPLNFSLPFF
jgi:hypothetical protein